MLEVGGQDMLLKFLNIPDNEGSPLDSPSNYLGILLILQNVVSFLNKVTHRFLVLLGQRSHVRK